MRPTSVAAVVILIGVLIGCGGKGGSTSAPDPAPAIEAPPNRVTLTAPATSNTPPPAGTAPKDSKEKITVEIAKARFVINGTELPLPGGLPGFEKELGKPSDSSERGVYRGLFWKSLGIKALQEKSGPQRVIQFTFHFEKHDDVFDNVQCDPFPGVIILDGERVTKDTNMAELGKKISGLTEKARFTWELNYTNSSHVYIDAAFRVGPKGAPQNGVDKFTISNTIP